MNKIIIEFHKLELGTLFYDTTTRDYYRKVSDTEAEPESNDRYYRRVEWSDNPNDVFHPNELVIV